MSIWQLWRQACSGAYTVEGRPEEADCVLGFSFGGLPGSGGITPGPSNEDLARFARERLTGLPLILQGEIDDAYQVLAPGSPVFRLGQHRQAGKHFDTREVAEQALVIMRPRGWQRAVVLAHAFHLPRCAEVCRQVGITPIVPGGLDRVRFCPGSFQWWTRNRWAWIAREVPAILYYRRRGWV